MNSQLKRRIVIGMTALAAAAFAGGAYAASQDSTTNARQAFLNDLANRLHVTPQQLAAAMKGAFIDQLNAAVKAGRLTQTQANAIERRVQQGALPPPFFAPHGPHGFGSGGFGPPGLHRQFRGGTLGAAASYLGLSDQQLLDQLGSGKSLAEVASSRGKSVSGLKNAMTEAVRSKLNQAVANGMITKAQEQRLLSRLSARLDGQINRSGPPFKRPPRQFFAPPGGASEQGPPGGGPPVPLPPVA